MAIKFDPGILGSDRNFGFVREQQQNADLRPQRAPYFASLAVADMPSATGNLSMDPIPGLPSVATAEIPFKNLRKQ